MLATHQVLLVGEEGVILYAPADKGLHRTLSLRWTQQDITAQVTEAVAGRGKQPVVLLFNHADQTYRREENVSAAECQKKFEDALPGARFPGRAVMADAGVAGSYLMVALPPHERMDVLRGALAGAQVAGCGVLPVESVGLVGALAAKAFGGSKRHRWAALMGQHEMGGLRQVVTHDGILALTRLTPVDEDALHGQRWADNAAEEFRVTANYLARFGYREQEGLDLVVTCGADEMRGLQARALAATRVRCMTPEESLKLLDCHVSGLGENRFADDLHAAWVEHRHKLILPIPMAGLMAA